MREGGKAYKLFVLVSQKLLVSWQYLRAHSIGTSDIMAGLRPGNTPCCTCNGLEPTLGSMRGSPNPLTGVNWDLDCHSTTLIEPRGGDWFFTSGSLGAGQNPRPFIIQNMWWPFPLLCLLRPHTARSSFMSWWAVLPSRPIVNDSYQT